MSVPDRQRIAHALLATDALRDRSTRELVVRTLQDYLDRPIEVRRYDNERADVFSLVDACARRPGTLHTLMQVVQYFEPGSLALDGLRDLIDEIDPKRQLSGAARADLLEIVTSLVCPDAKDLYWLAVGAFGPAPQDVGSVSALVHELEDLTMRPHGLPPLIIFLELLAFRLPTQAPVLHEWVDAQVAGSDAEVRQLETLRTSVPELLRERQSPRSHLVVQLEPYGPDPQRYLLSAVLQRGPASKPLRRDLEPLEIEQVPAELDKLLTREPEVTTDRSAQLVLEVILPRQLLDRDIDQWPISPGGFDRPVGTEHPVVIRAYERLHDPALHREWRRKWEWIKAHGGRVGGVPDAVHWIKHRGAVDPEQLMIQLKTYITPVCIGIAFAPSRTSAFTPDEFTAAIYAGAPVIVWCRDERRPDDFESELRGLIGSRDFRGLPDLIHVYRQRAHHPDGSGSHLGRHLTLLWDDADRTFDDVDYLRPPAKGTP